MPNVSLTHCLLFLSTLSSGPHRLVFVVYQQRSAIPTHKVPEDSLSGDSRRSFNLGRFIRSHPQILSDQVWAGSFIFVGAENAELLSQQRHYNSIMRPIEEQKRLPSGGSRHPRPAKAAGWDASALKQQPVVSSRPEKEDIEA